VISRAEYQQFCVDYIDLDIYKMQRFGQAFCNHFRVDDTELFYRKDIKACEDLIEQKHIKAL